MPDEPQPLPAEALAALYTQHARPSRQPPPVPALRLKFTFGRDCWQCAVVDIAAHGDLTPLADHHQPPAAPGWGSSDMTAASAARWEAFQRQLVDALPHGFKPMSAANRLRLERQRRGAA